MAFPLEKIRAVSIDLDDTLWEIAPVILRAEQRMHTWLKQRFPDTMGGIDQNFWMALRGDVLAEHPGKDHDYTFLRREMLRRVARLANAADDAADEGFAVFLEERNKVQCFEDVVPVLKRLKSRFSLLALTNGNADLKVIGLSHWFDMHLCPAQVGAAKPSARFFAMAASQAGLHCSQIVHIGDHPVDDVHGARNAGFHSVWMNRFDREWPGEIDSPATEVSDLYQLAELLQV